jgi:hypothetical protein
MAPLSICHRLLLLLLLSVATFHGDSSGATYDPSMCLNQTYTCGDISISYPFYLSEQTKDLNGYSNSYCGYPGLGILCDDDKPILRTDSGKNCTVTSFQSTSANLYLSDPEVVDGSCPRVDHNVTFGPSSWLNFPDSTVDYLVFFLRCYFTSGSGFVQPPNIRPITCPDFLSSVPGLSFVIPDESVPEGNWPRACDKVIEAPVRKHGPVDAANTAWRDTGYGEVLRQGFQVSWEDNKPSACKKCEKSNGQCTYRENGEFLGCFCANGEIKDKNCGKYNSTRKHFSVKHPVF